VLDHVERGRFLVEPAREHPLPLPVRPLHVDLDERAGQLLAFPRCGRLARAKSNDDVLHLHRLARLQGQVADDSVPLVEQTEHGNAIRHGSDPRLFARRRSSGVLLRAHSLWRRLLLLAPAAAEKEQRHCGAGEQLALHAYSGFQGS
jgi:hypothetical protein